MPDNTSPPLSAAQHAIFNLKQHRAEGGPFPGEAIGILERFVAAAAVASKDIWPNGCATMAPKALRYLADNERPSGGEQTFNSAHLFQIAAELERAVRNTAHPAENTSRQAAVEALLATISDAELFDILKAAGRADQLDYRLPGTSRSHKVTCAILEEPDMALVREKLLAKAV